MNAGLDRESANAAYHALRRRVEAAGLLEPDLAAYRIRAAWIVPLWLACGAALTQTQDWPARLLLAAVTAFVSIQAAAIAHEAGHGAITADAGRIRLIGLLFMTLIMGSSFSSWLAKHRPHHGHANTRQDPDMRAGLFNFTREDAVAARGAARWFTRRQPWLIWPLATLMGFAFKIGSLRHFGRHPRQTRLDQLLLALHLGLLVILPAVLLDPATAAVNYLLITWCEGLYLAFIFLTNHLGHPTDAMQWQRSYIERQAACARNLPDTWLYRNVFVGLNSHIEHHLFPTASFTRLHRIRPMVQQACAQLGIPYHQVSLLGAFAEFHRHNRAMAASATPPALVRA
ncbi:fatty acid desaturase family protein [Chitinimonas koreensis]|uniref:fatty acid desaturase family protein n=1 Tax=Chitinimonas koreensis TaxID=356302 RepID=UPI000418460E|nr:acyl-CoA desaturase [Chitinimonas koreensis]